MAFPNARILNMQYKAGWFKNDPTRLNIYVQYNYITPADFKAITGVDFGTETQAPMSTADSASSEPAQSSTPASESSVASAESSTGGLQNYVNDSSQTPTSTTSSESSTTNE